jgi:ferredoxin--NADP+ reductase
MTHGDIPLPEVKMNLCRAAEPAIGRVTRSVTCTNRKASSFVRHVEIDVGGTPLEGIVRPGQSIGVVVSGTDDKGRPHSPRLYSVASPTGGEDGAGRVISTTVKRTIDEHWETHKLFLGVASNYLCDLNEGDEVRLTGPSGKRFLLPVDAAAHDYVFFATGTGVAPFRGFVTDLLRASPNGTRQPRVTLVMGSPYSTDLIYDDLFRELAAKHSNFRYLTAISRHAQTDDPIIGPLYVQDRMKTHREHFVDLLNSPRTLVYICGLAGMELGIVQHMSRMLAPEVASQYMTIDPSIAGQVDSWEKKMIHRQIKLSRRVFLEVYA